MTPGARSRFGALMFEPEALRKQMYCIEESTCDAVGTFRRCPQWIGARGIVSPSPPSLLPCFQVENISPKLSGKLHTSRSFAKVRWSRLSPLLSKRSPSLAEVLPHYHCRKLNVCNVVNNGKLSRGDRSHLCGRAKTRFAASVTTVLCDFLANARFIPTKRRWFFCNLLLFTVLCQNIFIAYFTGPSNKFLKIRHPAKTDGFTHSNFSRSLVVIAERPHTGYTRKSTPCN